jgi:imidazolonepropionase
MLAAPQVVTCGPEGILEPGFVAIQDGLIAEVGPGCPAGSEKVSGSLVPGLVDPHSHPLFGGSRVHEFEMRARGATYQEIHAAGGGIACTVRGTREASDEQLKALTRQRLLRQLQHGATTIEVKTGYGLSTLEELRHLRLYAELREELQIPLVLTFMGAHSIPPEHNQEDYVRLVIEDMIPAVAQQGLAEFGDVFCEQGAFSVEESRRILQACTQAGLKLRIHAEEFTPLGGARMAAELGAHSADHLQFLPPEDFEALRSAGTVAVMTAGTSFFLGMSQFAPARALWEAGVCVALGSDFNAGSCLSESMQMALSLAVLKLKLTPEEALLAATRHAARSLGREHQVGSLEVGKRADLLMLNLADAREWPYHYGVNCVERVYLGGRLVVG